MSGEHPSIIAKAKHGKPVKNSKYATTATKKIKHNKPVKLAKPVTSVTNAVTKKTTLNRRITKKMPVAVKTKPVSESKADGASLARARAEGIAKRLALDGNMTMLPKNINSRAYHRAVVTLKDAGLSHADACKEAVHIGHEAVHEAHANNLIAWDIS